MSNYKKVAIGLAYQAGKIMRKNFVLKAEKTWKSDNTPLTKTDLTVNKLVLNVLSQNFPEHGIIAEEESLKKNSEYQWVCDPLDGTIPFSHGFPIFTFVLALVKDGESIIGLIYDPMMERLFFAERGKGAFINNKKISVSNQMRLNKYSVVELNTHHRLLGLRNKIIGTGSHILSVVSTSYASSLVACGSIVANVYDYSNPWDGAAAKIIVEEAGGKVTDLSGKEQRYDRKINGFIASNSFVHYELVELCKNALK